MTDQEFLDACKSARVVKTHAEWAILIGDEVIEIRSSYGSHNRAHVLGMAIRGEKIAPPQYEMKNPSTLNARAS